MGTEIFICGDTYLYCCVWAHLYIFIVLHMGTLIHIRNMNMHFLPTIMCSLDDFPDFWGSVSEKRPARIGLVLEYHTHMTPWKTTHTWHLGRPHTHDTLEYHTHTWNTTHTWHGTPHLWISCMFLRVCVCVCVSWCVCGVAGEPHPIWRICLVSTSAYKSGVYKCVQEWCLQVYLSSIQVSTSYRTHTHTYTHTHTHTHTLVQYRSVYLI